MGLTPMFNLQQMKGAILDFADQMQSSQMEALARIGEEFVNNAKDNGSYEDRTGNLRNSVGYVIALDGEVMDSKFFASGNPQDDTGIKKGMQMAQSISQQYKGLVLIGVAGMEYAAAVERKGYDVITGSVPEVQEFLKEVLPG